MQVGDSLMRVRITRTWQLDWWPAAKLEAGQVFDVATSLAIYLFALCAEPCAPELA